MDLTPQRGAFSRVLNRLARNTKIVFSPQRGGFSLDMIQKTACCVPFGPGKGLKGTRCSWLNIGSTGTNMAPTWRLRA